MIYSSHSIARGTGSRFLVFTLYLLVLCCSAFGTPDHQVDIEDQFLGSNESGYAVLRTEHDNLSSYFGGITRRYVDEYEKDVPKGYESPANPKPVKSTLILEVKSTRDPEQPSAKPTSEEIFRDSTVLLADVLSRYPQTLSPWSEDQRRRLEVNQTGINIGRLLVLWGGEAKRKLCGDQNADIEWVLEDVARDNDCVFLRVGLPPERDEKQSRLLCLPKELSQQARDHLVMSPMYIATEGVNTLEEAVQNAAKLRGIDKNRELAIWSLKTPADQVVYVVAVCVLTPERTGGGFADLEKLLGMRLYPQSSERFLERFLFK